jgi:hypothetical protein
MSRSPKQKSRVSSVATARFATAEGIRERVRAGRSRNSEASMTTFDKREEGFEKQFAVDEELKLATARRKAAQSRAAANRSRQARLCQGRGYGPIREAGDHDVPQIRGFGAKACGTDLDRRTMDDLMASGPGDQGGQMTTDRLLPPLRAGETVHSGWCGLPAPIVAGS